MTEKKRLDVLLFERGLAESREKAKTAIMSGLVYVNGQKEDKAGTAFRDSEELKIEVRGTTLRYVSRGGLKLEKALQVFPISPKGKICIDVGASTGGFTDCMLQNGAEKIYAVDVGHGQLDWKLRNDPRVVCMEKTNIRYLDPAAIPEALDFAACDVSFISLEKVIPAVLPVLSPEAVMVCLIKPQFEAGREEVGKKGVVRDKKVHVEVVEKVVNFLSTLDVQVRGLDFSPIRGPEGNIEYLVYFSKEKLEEFSEQWTQEKINFLVEEAHNNFKVSTTHHLKVVGL